VRFVAHFCRTRRLIGQHRSPNNEKVGFRMPDVTVKTARTTSQVAEGHKISGANRSSCSGLDSRYGRIGISAVAAAARYQGDTKNPAYAPAPTNWRDKYAAETV